MEFLDLNHYHNQRREELNQIWETLLEDSQFIGSANNPHVLKFEKEFSEFLELTNFIACANGTDAIEIALMAMGIGQGDEVIVPAISWYSTAEAVANIGAKPVFASVNEADCLIDVESVKALINKNTKAIIPVHLYGKPADMERLLLLAEEFDLYLIEDCAQAHGAAINDKKVGSFGDAATFSFYPGKNLGAFGDAGGMTFKNETHELIARQIRNHGQSKKHTHHRLGRNSRMDGLHAAILSLKLKDLDFHNQKRIDVARKYDTFLNANVVKPLFEDGVKSVFHLYVIQVQNRSDFIELFNKKSVPFGIHYPKPLPILEPFNLNGFEEEERICNSILSLPMHPFLAERDIKSVCDLVNSKH